jgi:hypothetical protein
MMSGNQNDAQSDFCLSDQFVKRPCDGPGCSNRRIHHERPDEPRGVVMVEVPESYTGKAYCSLECYCYAKGTKIED